ncbi:MAG: hypothetical protein ACFCUU_16350 [Cyclobacteriaceae bacterium]
MKLKKGILIAGIFVAILAINSITAKANTGEENSATEIQAYTQSLVESYVEKIESECIADDVQKLYMIVDLEGRKIYETRNEKDERFVWLKRKSDILLQSTESDLYMINQD